MFQAVEEEIHHPSKMEKRKTEGLSTVLETALQPLT